MIPKNEILDDINGIINIKAKQKNYPVFYSESTISGYQDYALCTDLYSEVYANTDVYVCSNKSKLIINKIDGETNEPIKGVKFQITNSYGDTSTFTTDENGKILLANLKQGEVIIKEIEAVGKYKINDEELKIHMDYDDVKEVEIKNNLKKGNIKIIKTDKDDENIKLENVKFHLIDDNNNIIKEGVTDEKGELLFENIVVGKYKIVEVETRDEYMLYEGEIIVNLKDGQTEEVIVKNEKIPEQPEEPQEPEKPQQLEKPQQPEQPKQPEQHIEKIITENKELPKTGYSNSAHRNILSGAIITIFALIIGIRKILKM